jgi:galactonate dehydratase
VRNPHVWSLKGGYIDLLTGPGIGIKIDEERVRKLSVDAVPWVFLNLSVQVGR